MTKFAVALNEPRHTRLHVVANRFVHVAEKIGGRFGPYFAEVTLVRERLPVQEIAAAAGVEVGQDRIAQEIVIMVEKGDIAEELTRLDHHVDQIEKAIAGKEAAGKKLDFLSQEMLREINTMGSKSRSAAIRTLVVELKTEVERIREQVQNVE